MSERSKIGAMHICLFALFGVFLAGSAMAQELPGSAVQGREFARTVCAACHAVEKGERDGALPDPPAFQRLADDPAMTALALRVFLTTPHRNMPNLILSDTEIDDVIAWIHSLKGAG